MDYFDNELVNLDQKLDNLNQGNALECKIKLMCELDILEPRTMRFILGIDKPKLPSIDVMYNIAMLDRINEIQNYITRGNKDKKIKWLRTYNSKYKSSPYEYMYNNDRLDLMFILELQRYYEVKAERDNRPKTD